MAFIAIFLSLVKNYKSRLWLSTTSRLFLLNMSITVQLDIITKSRGVHRVLSFMQVFLVVLISLHWLNPMLFKLSYPGGYIKCLFKFISNGTFFCQFRGAVTLAESLDRMSVNARYRKYKPAVKLKGNSTLWYDWLVGSCDSL